MKEFIEKLIGRLEEKSVEITFPLYPDDSTSFVPLTEAISIVNQLAEEYNNGWISVEDRLPENYNNLLICQSNGYVSVGYYSLGEFKDLNSYLYKDVIAWQPLLEPYKEK